MARKGIRAMTTRKTMSSTISTRIWVMARSGALRSMNAVASRNPMPDRLRTAWRRFRNEAARPAKAIMANRMMARTRSLEVSRVGNSRANGGRRQRRTPSTNSSSRPA